MGKWTLTPSLRVATFSHVNKDGHEVLVESDGRTKLCRHGETAASIRSWALLEARARAKGREPPKTPYLATNGRPSRSRRRSR